MRFSDRPLARSKFRGLFALAAALTTAAACSSTPPAEEPQGTTVVPVPETTACAPGVRSERCPEASSTPPAGSGTCVEGAPGPRCDGILAPDEAKALTTAIDAARQAVLDSTYSDVHAMVEGARLALRRDSDIADMDGPTDAARALKNAMRAVAVDDGAAAPRVALALARARSLVGAKAMSDPVTRAGALVLVEIALRSLPAGNGSATAAARTMEGYLALERGDRAAAKTAFEAATTLDPSLGTAWMGLGDAARAEGAFDTAASAYKTAAARLPADPAVRRALEMASRREPLSLPAPPTIAFRVGWDPLAPAAPPVAKCPGTVKSPSPGASLCRGLADLAKATTRDEHERGAMLVLDGWKDVQPLCEKHDPACGPHVAQALAAASRSLHTAGRLAKSIAAGLLVLRYTDLPGATGLLPTVALELADRYLSVGLADTAADQYARHLQLEGKTRGPVAQRTLALRLALGNAEAATKLAEGLAGDTASPAADRASALLATAALVRMTKGSEAAVSWLGHHKDVVEQAGMAAAMKDLAKPVSERAASPECAAPLVCAVRRLAGESRWSP